MKKIAIIEPTGIDISAYYEALPQCDVIEMDSRAWSDERLIESIKDCDIIALSNRPVSTQVIDSLPNLKFISLAFSGIDHVNANAVKAHNIIVGWSQCFASNGFCSANRRIILEKAVGAYYEGLLH